MSARRIGGAGQAGQSPSSPGTCHSALFSSTSRSTAASSSALSSVKQDPPERRAVNGSIYLTVSPGRQVGLFAARSLLQGDRILAEAPLCTLNSPGDLTSVLEDARASFYALANAYADDGHTSAERGIFDTNAFSLSPSPTAARTPSASPRYGIFPCSSRLNHSCRPNVKASYSPSTGLLVTHVLRPVLPDEELLTSYLGGPALYGTSTAARCARLAEGWAFACSCEVCSLGPTSPERRASDARRAELGALHARLPGVRPLDAAQTLRDCARALALLEAEGLAVDGVEAFALPAARACAWHEDWRAARVWVALGWESGRRAYGVKSPVEQMLRAAKDRPAGLVPAGVKGEKGGLLKVTREALGERAMEVERGGQSWLSRLFRD
ncbi:hypothetical protein JCM3770_005354 [Rhodotorula araucariae]